MEHLVDIDAVRHMRWHKEGVHENPDVMAHLADIDAWTALDAFDSSFADEVQNVRFGLATDGFSPFNPTALSYSCWPVLAVPYNLPLALCMKYEFVFLCLVIPGPDHPGTKIDVMMRPLIEELKILWKELRCTIVTRNRISTLGLHFCGRFTILWLMVSLLDGVVMVF
jgi:hypothetical protein